MKKMGDWKKVSQLIGNLSHEMEKAKETSLKRWALKAEGTAKKHMSMQDLNWQALKLKTIAAKQKRGESTATLIATSDYFQAITSWVQEGTAYAGVRKQVRNVDGEIIADIARVHEYGRIDGRIPARPLWQPTFKETLGWFSSSESTPIKIFEKSIQKYL